MEIFAWNVKVSLKTRFTVFDSKNSVSWDKNLTINSYIPVTNFYDPIYVVSTNGLIENKINKTIYNLSSVANLNLHLQNSYYIASSLAPSFLDRLQGKFSASPYGIESLVYLPKLSAQGIPTLTKSGVDYIYFSGSNPAYTSVSGMPSWFYLDNPHLAVYGVL